MSGFLALSISFSNVDFSRALQKGLQKQRLLVREIPVNGSMGDSRLFCNIADTDFIERLDGKHALGGLDDNGLTRELGFVFDMGESFLLFHNETSISQFIRD
jgi:hypothetical protein